MFRDCSHIEVYSADGQVSFVVTNEAEIAELARHFSPSFVKFGHRVNSIPGGVFAAVGYPYSDDGERAVFVVNVHSNGMVSHLRSLKEVAVSHMPQYCHEVASLCRRYHHEQ
jgi:hypothetical protein